MKRKKYQLTSKQQGLHDADQQMLAKWAAVPKFARTAAPARTEGKAVGQLQMPPEKPKSLVTPGGSTALKPSPRYTGDKMLGIATMHKSNAVPVFAAEDAKDITNMRRG